MARDEETREEGGECAERVGTLEWRGAEVRSGFSEEKCTLRLSVQCGGRRRTRQKRKATCRLGGLDESPGLYHDGDCLQQRRCPWTRVPSAMPISVQEPLSAKP
ncbi:hypothetical protein GCM10020220_000010 [Nonomuraea rubra]